MIRYQLACDEGHDFESWFRDSASYDDQASRGLLTCPFCGSAKVQKALMAPRLGKAGSSADRRGSKPQAGEAGVPSAPGGEAAQPVTLVSPEEQAFRTKLREVREHLLRNSEHVGRRFAEQARKMHEGDLEHRTIHGEASAEEVRDLLEDGVPVSPLPMLPDERN